MASELYASIGGQPNQVWEKAAEMGRQLDPNNPLYSATAAGVMAKPVAEVKAAVEPVAPVLEDMPEFEEAAEDLSPDLNFDLDEEPVAAESTAAEPEMAVADEEGALDFDLDLGSMEAVEPEEELIEPVAATGNETEMAGLSMDTHTIIPQVIAKQAAQAMESAEADVAPLDMDQALSFGLPEIESAQAAEMPEFAPESEFVLSDVKDASQAEQIELEVPEFNEIEMGEAPQENSPACITEAPLDFDFS